MDKEKNIYIVIDTDGSRIEFKDEREAQDYAMGLSKKTGESIRIKREPNPYHSIVDVCNLEAWLKKHGKKF